LQELFKEFENFMSMYPSSNQGKAKKKMKGKAMGEILYGEVLGS